MASAATPSGLDSAQNTVPGLSTVPGTASAGSIVANVATVPNAASTGNASVKGNHHPKKPKRRPTGCSPQTDFKKVSFGEVRLPPSAVTPEEFDNPEARQRLFPDRQAKAWAGFQKEQARQLSLAGQSLGPRCSSATLAEAQSRFPWIGLFHPDDISTNKYLPYIARNFNRYHHWQINEHFWIEENLSRRDLLQIYWEIDISQYFHSLGSARARTRTFLYLKKLPKQEAIKCLVYRTREQAHEVILQMADPSKSYTGSLEPFIPGIQHWIQSKYEEKAQQLNTLLAKVEETLPVGTQGSVRSYWVNDKDHLASPYHLLDIPDTLLLTEVTTLRMECVRLEEAIVEVSPYTKLIHVRSKPWCPSMDAELEQVAWVNLPEATATFFDQGARFMEPNPRQHAAAQVLFRDIQVNSPEGQTVVFHAIKQPEAYTHLTHD
ncbi:hypothetical protein JCM33374_g4714 [Metschnikowia sp. JCM 33374]|nr:hypothetical protein JCM33374_g4714 [Metschnikowia sp. JCM 33374]